ncbi:MAG: ankyrin repeat domain-containing protein [Gammaproteobacteria bacterium]
MASEVRLEVELWNALKSIAKSIEGDDSEDKAIDTLLDHAHKKTLAQTTLLHNLIKQISGAKQSGKQKEQDFYALVLKKLVKTAPSALEYAAPNNGFTPLHFAAYYNLPKVIKVLLDKNDKNINTRTQIVTGPYAIQTALEIAITRGSLETVQVLLARQKIVLIHRYFFQRFDLIQTTLEVATSAKNRAIQALKNEGKIHKVPGKRESARNAIDIIIEVLKQEKPRNFQAKIDQLEAEKASLPSSTAEEYRDLPTRVESDDARLTDRARAATARFFHTPVRPIVGADISDNGNSRFAI